MARILLLAIALSVSAVGCQEFAQRWNHNSPERIEARRNAKCRHPIPVWPDIKIGMTYSEWKKNLDAQPKTISYNPNKHDYGIYLMRKVTFGDGGYVFHYELQDGQGSLYNLERMVVTFDPKDGRLRVTNWMLVDR